jgi:hypothetical protein
MRVTVIHPGEHLSEELKELGMSAAALARNLGVPDEPHHRNIKRTACDHRRHGLATRPFLRHECGILAQLAEPLRTSRRPEKDGERNKGASAIEAFRAEALARQHRQAPTPLRSRLSKNHGLPHA